MKENQIPKKIFSRNWSLLFLFWLLGTFFTGEIIQISWMHNRCGGWAFLQNTDLACQQNMLRLFLGGLLVLAVEIFIYLIVVAGKRVLTGKKISDRARDFTLLFSGTIHLLWLVNLSLQLLGEFKILGLPALFLVLFCARQLHKNIEDYC